jgi:hypothetical protein
MKKFFLMAIILLFFGFAKAQWTHVVIDDKIFKSTKKHIGNIDYSLGNLEKGDFIVAEFVSNGINDGFDWYRVTKVKDVNTGNEYFVHPYYVTFQSMNVDTYRPNGRKNLRKY